MHACVIVVVDHAFEFVDEFMFLFTTFLQAEYQDLSIEDWIENQGGWVSVNELNIIEFIV